MTNYKTISSLIFLASLSACGGGGGDAAGTAAAGTDAYSAVVTGTPVISSASSYSVQENQTAIATATATDSDSSTLTFYLTGTDASALSINSSSGVMTFNTAPDFETKSSYAVILNVSD